MIGTGFEFAAGVFGFILVCFLIVGVFYLIKDAFEDLQSRIQSRKWQRKRLLERKNRDKVPDPNQRLQATWNVLASIAELCLRKRLQTSAQIRSAPPSRRDWRRGTRSRSHDRFGLDSIAEPCALRSSQQTRNQAIPTR
jgi:hypothetical protein